MTFTRKSADLVPIEDTVFAVVNMAKKDKEANGEDVVTDATIGSLYDESGKLVAYSSVFDHYDAIDHRTKAAYASSFTGNPDFRKDVYDWVVAPSGISLAHSVIATPGGSGAVFEGMNTFLDAGETVLLPDIAWGSYKLMASQYNFKVKNYAMFEGDHFNLTSVKEAITEILKTQDKVVMVLNAPCHNPTGYSLSDEEWKELIEILNAAGKTSPVILINDIAYIDYSYNGDHSRDYMKHFESVSENVMIEIAFSTSKTLTSYGLRCGAAILLAKDPVAVREAEIVFEKTARATWSNIPNAAMVNFSWIVEEGKDLFMKEKEEYVTLMKKRSDIFVSEAVACELPCYPYKEGFFVTLKLGNNEEVQKVHDAFIQNHIYTVRVNKGIRVAVCSLPVNKVYGLAKRMKQIEEEVL